VIFPRSSWMVLYEDISSRESSISLNICSKLAVKPAPHSSIVLVRMNEGNEYVGRTCF
jgi:hypothetical protein